MVLFLEGAKSWVPGSLWVSFSSGSSEILREANAFIQQKLLSGEADAVLSEAAALWHLLS